MSSLLAGALILHIVLGLIGLACIHFALMQLIRREPPYGLASKASFLSVAFFLFSWVTGAYYYVTYYGSAVKPRILAGAYPWAHQVMMESKEHIFLLIPFLVIAVWLASRALEGAGDTRLKVVTAAAAAVSLTLGVLVAAAGILISGAVK